MFQALRQGSPIWVMDKSNLTLQVGSVVSTSLQTSGFNQIQWIQPVAPPTMDITVQMEDGTQSEFKQLCPTQLVAQYGNVVVAETPEVMAREIDNLDRQSQQVIESVQYHTKARAAFEEMKKKLSPSYAKEKQNDERLTALENSQAQMANGISAIQAMLSKMGGNMPNSNSNHK